MFLIILATTNMQNMNKPSSTIRNTIALQCNIIYDMQWDIEIEVETI